MHQKQSDLLALDQIRSSVLPLRPRDAGEILLLPLLYMILVRAGNKGSSQILTTAGNVLTSPPVGNPPLQGLIKGTSPARDPRNQGSSCRGPVAPGTGTTFRTICEQRAGQCCCPEDGRQRGQRALLPAVGAACRGQITPLTCLVLRGTSHAGNHSSLELQVDSYGEKMKHFKAAEQQQRPPPPIPLAARPLGRPSGPRAPPQAVYFPLMLPGSYGGSSCSATVEENGWLWAPF